ncbi:hypothetical protein B0H13DRAFT_1868910 [Mycena leptocephala]|nr:hypothetical protein B0H13DRAFT_1868910 [Mycena leptocephala]
MANPGGRPKDSKNNAGHRAGGSRRGSGRKRKETRKAESDSPEPEAPRKRKKQKTLNPAPPDVAETQTQCLLQPLYTTEETLRNVHIPNLIPPEITTPDSIPSEAFDSITQLASPNNSSISPDDESERPAEDTPNPGEAVQFYLDRKLEEIIQETKGDRPPQCYQDGTFWVRPPDGWFVLQEDFENPYKPQAAPQDPAQINFGPETLYYPSIFVWIPTALLPKDFAIKCVFCGKDNMGESGWNSNPVARRVSCKKSCSMYNHNVLKQLPPLLRSQFPAFLTHRSGIDKSVMTLIRSTIAHGLTPNGWEHVFRELHVRKRDLAERAYLYALNARAPNKRPTRLTPFSSFSDKNGYAGFSPSR